MLDYNFLWKANEIENEPKHPWEKPGLSEKLSQKALVKEEDKLGFVFKAYRFEFIGGIVKSKWIHANFVYKENAFSLLYNLDPSHPSVTCK